VECWILKVLRIVVSVVLNMARNGLSKGVIVCHVAAQQ
jgi:hypothetical protein